MNAKQVRWCMVIDLTRLLGLLCFVVSSFGAIKCKYDTFTMYEGWGIALLCIYAVNKYKVYCTKREREELGCYENSK